MAFARAPLSWWEPKTSVGFEVNVTVATGFYIEEVECGIVYVLDVVLLAPQVNYEVTKFV